MKTSPVRLAKVPLFIQEKAFLFFVFCFSGVNSAVRIGIQKNEDGSFTNTDEAFKTPHVSDAILDLITCKSRKVGVTPLL